jgi:N-acetylglutamate synthase-like GNAT family acetyltransferase
MYTYSETLDSESVGRFHELLKTTYWAGERSRETVEKALKNSRVIAAFHEGKLIGGARAVTDAATFSWICDVVVAPEHRGRGVARQMVEKLLAHPDVGPTRKILVTRDAQRLYHQFGFTTHPSECMIKYPES